MILHELNVIKKMKTLTVGDLNFNSFILLLRTKFNL